MASISPSAPSIRILVLVLRCKAFLVFPFEPIKTPTRFFGILKNSDSSATIIPQTASKKARQNLFIPLDTSLKLFLKANYAFFWHGKRKGFPDCVFRIASEYSGKN